MPNPVELAIQIDHEVEQLDELDRPGHCIEDLLDSVVNPNREECSNAIRALLRFPEARMAVLS